MAFFDTVPREFYERERDRANDLQEKYDALVKVLTRLKKAGYQEPHEAKPGRVVQAGPTPEEMAHRRLNEQLVENLAKDIESIPGIDPQLARREADRIRKEALGASVGEPSL